MTINDPREPGLPGKPKASAQRTRQNVKPKDGRTDLRRGNYDRTRNPNAPDVKKKNRTDQRAR